MLQVRILLLSLLVVSSLAASPVTERPVSEPRMGTASGSAWRSMQTSWNGERFLATWYSRLRGGQAMVFDAAGQPVAETATGLPLNPEAVFWRDDAWYVVGDGQGVFGWVRVSADGVLLDLQPRPLERGRGIFRGAVWTGESLIAVFVDVLAQPAATVAKVYDAALQPKATHTIARWAIGVSLLTDGPTALVAFRENGTSTMQAVLFGRDGQLLRQRTIEGVPVAYDGASRGDGTGYFFISASAAGSTTSLSSFELDHDLVATRGADSFGPQEGLYPHDGTHDLAWNGSAYTFFYRSPSTGLRMSRVAAGGSLLEDVALLPLTGSDWASGLATAGGMGTTILLYQTSDVSSTSAETHVLRLRAGHDSVSLAAAPELTLERGAFAQTDPVAASSDTQALVAWQEHVSLTEPPRIYATRVLHGEVRDPQSLLLGTLSDWPSNVRLASNGEGFVAAWTDPEGVVTRHIAADGTVGPKTVVHRLEILTPAPLLEVVSNGDGYLVAWIHDSITPDRTYAVRLRGDGAIIDATPRELGPVRDVIIGASNGTGYLLAGRGQGVLVSDDGTVTASFALGANVAEAAWWNGASYSVLTRSDPYNPNAYRVVQVTAGGSVTAGSSFSWPADMSWAAGPFDVCGTSGCSALRGTVEEGQFFLREQRVTASGFTYGSGMPVLPAASRFDDNLRRGALFRLPGGRLWAAVERLAHQPPYAGISRIFIVALDPSRVRSVRHR